MVFLPKTHNSRNEHEKSIRQIPIEEQSRKYQTVIPQTSLKGQTQKVVKNKENSRNFHSQKEPKETQY